MESATRKGPGRPRDETLPTRRREQILDVAASVFAQYGYPNADMDYVAKALHVGKGTIYRYFSSKQELFLAAADGGMRQVHEHIETACVGITDPLVRLSRTICAYLGFFREHPQYTELLIQERAEFKDRPQQTYFAHREQNLRPWRQWFEELIAAGRVRQIPVDRIVEVISDLVYGAMFTNHFTGRHKPLDVQTQDILDVVFYGILTDKEPSHLSAQKFEAT
jgi:AcrR family transcriptional regulator